MARAWLVGLALFVACSSPHGFVEPDGSGGEPSSGGSAAGEAPGAAGSTTGEAAGASSGGDVGYSETPGSCTPGKPRCHGDFGYQVCQEDGSWSESRSCA